MASQSGVGRAAAALLLALAHGAVGVSSQAVCGGLFTHLASATPPLADLAGVSDMSPSPDGSLLLANPATHQLLRFNASTGDMVAVLGNGTAGDGAVDWSTAAPDATLRDPISAVMSARTSVADQLLYWIDGATSSTTSRVRYMLMGNRTVGTVLEPAGGTTVYRRLALVWRAGFGRMTNPPNDAPLLILVSSTGSNQFSVQRLTPTGASVLPSAGSSATMISPYVSSTTTPLVACTSTMCYYSRTSTGNVVSIGSFSANGATGQSVNTLMGAVAIPGGTPQLVDLAAPQTVGDGSFAFPGSIVGLAVEPTGNALYISDGWAVREMQVQSGSTLFTLFAANGSSGQNGTDGPIVTRQRGSTASAPVPLLAGVSLLAALPVTLPPPPGYAVAPPGYVAVGPQPAFALSLFALQGAGVNDAAAPKLRRVSSALGWLAMDVSLSSCDVTERRLACEPGHYLDTAQRLCVRCSICGVFEVEVSSCLAESDRQCARGCGRRQQQTMRDSYVAVRPADVPTGVAKLAGAALGPMVALGSSQVLVAAGDDPFASQRNVVEWVHLPVRRSTTVMGAVNEPGSPPLVTVPALTARVTRVVAMSRRIPRALSRTAWSPAADITYRSTGGRGDLDTQGDVLIVHDDGLSSGIWGLAIPTPNPFNTAPNPPSPTLYPIFPNTTAVRYIAVSSTPVGDGSATMVLTSGAPVDEEVTAIAWAGSSLVVARRRYFVGNASWGAIDPQAVVLCSSCSTRQGEVAAFIATSFILDYWGLPPPPFSFTTGGGTAAAPITIIASDASGADTLFVRWMPETASTSTIKQGLAYDPSPSAITATGYLPGLSFATAGPLRGLVAHPITPHSFFFVDTYTVRRVYSNDGGFNWYVERLFGSHILLPPTAASFGPPDGLLSAADNGTFPLLHITIAPDGIIYVIENATTSADSPSGSAGPYTPIRALAGDAGIIPVCSGVDHQCVNVALGLERCANVCKEGVEYLRLGTPPAPDICMSCTVCEPWQVELTPCSGTMDRTCGTGCGRRGMLTYDRLTTLLGWEVPVDAAMLPPPTHYTALAAGSGPAAPLATVQRVRSTPGIAVAGSGGNALSSLLIVGMTGDIPGHDFSARIMAWAANGPVWSSPSAGPYGNRVAAPTSYALSLESSCDIRLSPYLSSDATPLAFRAGPGLNRFCPFDTYTLAASLAGNGTAASLDSELAAMETFSTTSGRIVGLTVNSYGDTFVIHETSPSPPAASRVRLLSQSFAPVAVRTIAATTTPGRFRSLASCVDVNGRAFVAYITQLTNGDDHVVQMAVIDRGPGNNQNSMLWGPFTVFDGSGNGGFAAFPLTTLALHQRCRRMALVGAAATVLELDLSVYHGSQPFAYGTYSSLGVGVQSRNRTLVTAGALAGGIATAVAYWHTGEVLIADAQSIKRVETLRPTVSGLAVSYNVSQGVEGTQPWDVVATVFPVTPLANASAVMTAAEAGAQSQRAVVSPLQPPVPGNNLGPVQSYVMPLSQLPPSSRDLSGVSAMHVTADGAIIIAQRIANVTWAAGQRGDVDYPRRYFAPLVPLEWALGAVNTSNPFPQPNGAQPPPLVLTPPFDYYAVRVLHGRMLSCVACAGAHQECVGPELETCQCRTGAYNTVMPPSPISCTPCTVCSDTEVEIAPCTPTSNRVCAAGCGTRHRRMLSVATLAETPSNMTAAVLQSQLPPPSGVTATFGTGLQYLRLHWLPRVHTPTLNVTPAALPGGGAWPQVYLTVPHPLVSSDGGASVPQSDAAMQPVPVTMHYQDPLNTGINNPTFPSGGFFQAPPVTASVPLSAVLGTPGAAGLITEHGIAFRDYASFQSISDFAPVPMARGLASLRGVALVAMTGNATGRDFRIIALHPALGGTMSHMQGPGSTGFVPYVAAVTVLGNGVDGGAVGTPIVSGVTPFTAAIPGRILDMDVDSDGYVVFAEYNVGSGNVSVWGFAYSYDDAMGAGILRDSIPPPPGAFAPIINRNRNLTLVTTFAYPVPLSGPAATRAAGEPSDVPPVRVAVQYWDDTGSSQRRRVVCVNGPKEGYPPGAPANTSVRTIRCFASVIITGPDDCAYVTPPPAILTDCTITGFVHVATPWDEADLGYPAGADYPVFPDIIRLHRPMFGRPSLWVVAGSSRSQRDRLVRVPVDFSGNYHREQSRVQAGRQSLSGADTDAASVPATAGRAASTLNSPVLSPANLRFASSITALHLGEQGVDSGVVYVADAVSVRLVIAEPSPAPTSLTVVATGDVRRGRQAVLVGGRNVSAAAVQRGYGPSGGGLPNGITPPLLPSHIGVSGLVEMPSSLVALPLSVFGGGGAQIGFNAPLMGTAALTVPPPSLPVPALVFQAFPHSQSLYGSGGGAWEALMGDGNPSVVGLPPSSPLWGTLQVSHGSFNTSRVAGGRIRQFVTGVWQPPRCSALGRGIYSQCDDTAWLCSCMPGHYRNTSGAVPGSLSVASCIPCTPCAVVGEAEAAACGTTYPLPAGATTPPQDRVCAPACGDSYAHITGWGAITTVLSPPPSTIGATPPDEQYIPEPLNAVELLSRHPSSGTVFTHLVASVADFQASKLMIGELDESVAMPLSYPPPSASTLMSTLGAPRTTAVTRWRTALGSRTGEPTAIALPSPSPSVVPGATVPWRPTFDRPITPQIRLGSYPMGKNYGVASIRLAPARPAPPFGAPGTPMPPPGWSALVLDPVALIVSEEDALDTSLNRLIEVRLEEGWAIGAPAQPAVMTPPPGVVPPPGLLFPALADYNVNITFIANTTNYAGAISFFTAGRLVDGRPAVYYRGPSAGGTDIYMATRSNGSECMQLASTSTAFADCRAAAALWSVAGPIYSNGSILVQVMALEPEGRFLYIGTSTSVLRLNVQLPVGSVQASQALIAGTWYAVSSTGLSLATMRTQEGTASDMPFYSEVRTIAFPPALYGGPAATAVPPPACIGTEPAWCGGAALMVVGDRYSLRLVNLTGGGLGSGADGPGARPYARTIVASAGSANPTNGPFGEDGPLPTIESVYTQRNGIFLSTGSLAFTQGGGAGARPRLRIIHAAVSGPIGTAPAVQALGGGGYTRLPTSCLDFTPPGDYDYLAPRLDALPYNQRLPLSSTLTYGSSTEPTALSLCTAVGGSVGRNLNLTALRLFAYETGHASFPALLTHSMSVTGITPLQARGFFSDVTSGNVSAGFGTGSYRCDCPFPSYREVAYSGAFYSALVAANGSDYSSIDKGRQAWGVCRRPPEFLPRPTSPASCGPPTRDASVDWAYVQTVVPQSVTVGGGGGSGVDDSLGIGVGTTTFHPAWITQPPDAIGSGASVWQGLGNVSVNTSVGALAYLTPLCALVGLSRDSGQRIVRLCVNPSTTVYGANAILTDPDRGRAWSSRSNVTYSFDTLIGRPSGGYGVPVLGPAISSTGEAQAIGDVVALSAVAADDFAFVDYDAARGGGTTYRMWRMQGELVDAAADTARVVAGLPARWRWNVTAQVLQGGDFRAMTIIREVRPVPPSGTLANVPVLFMATATGLFRLPFDTVAGAWAPISNLTGMGGAVGANRPIIFGPPQLPPHNALLTSGHGFISMVQPANYPGVGRINTLAPDFGNGFAVVAGGAGPSYGSLPLSALQTRGMATALQLASEIAGGTVLPQYGVSPLDIATASDPSPMTVFAAGVTAGAQELTTVLISDGTSIRAIRYNMNDPARSPAYTITGTTAAAGSVGAIGVDGHLALVLNDTSALGLGGVASMVTLANGIVLLTQRGATYAPTIATTAANAPPLLRALWHKEAVMVSCPSPGICSGGGGGGDGDRYSHVYTCTCPAGQMYDSQASAPRAGMSGGGCVPAPTPSNTPSPTSTSTPSYTASGTQTPSQTPSQSGTPTSTQTQTPSESPSQSGTQTPTPSQTPSQTASQTATPTPTSTQTATPSESPSQTATQTASPSGTPSQTGSNSGTSTGTQSPSESATQTASVTATGTGTASVGSSPSNTATQTASPSPTPTVSGTGSDTATPSPTVTPTQTATGSASAAVTPSVSGTGSGTGTQTATPSASTSGSGTSTESSTPTPAPAGESSSSTSTATSTATPTVTGTVTTSATRTATPTGSASPSPTRSTTAPSTASPSRVTSSSPVATASGAAVSFTWFTGDLVTAVVETNATRALGKPRCVGEVLALYAGNGSLSTTKWYDIAVGRAILLPSPVSHLFRVRGANQLCLAAVGSGSTDEVPASASLGTLSVPASAIMAMPNAHTIVVALPYAYTWSAAVQPLLHPHIISSVNVTITCTAGPLSAGAYNATAAAPWVLQPLPSAAASSAVTPSPSPSSGGGGAAPGNWSSAAILSLTAPAESASLPASYQRDGVAQLRVSLTLRNVAGSILASGGPATAAAVAALETTLAAALSLASPAQVRVANISDAGSEVWAGATVPRAHVLLRVLVDRGTWLTPFGAVTGTLPPTTDVSLVAHVRYRDGATAVAAATAGDAGTATGALARAMALVASSLADALGRNQRVGCTATAAFPAGVPNRYAAPGNV